MSEREIARANGLKRYQSEKECINGHLSSMRFVANGWCVECSALARIERAKDPIAVQKDRKSAKRYRGRMKLNEEFRRKNSQRSLRWKSKNPEAFKAILLTRKARKRNADGRFGGLDIARIMQEQKSLCVYCSVDVSSGYHLDHKMPLCKGGSNWPDNIQVLCATCNLRKSKKTHNEFLEYLKKEGLNHG